MHIASLVVNILLHSARCVLPYLAVISAIKELPVLTDNFQHQKVKYM